MKAPLSVPARPLRPPRPPRRTTPLEGPGSGRYRPQPGAATSPDDLLTEAEGLARNTHLLGPYAGSF